MKRYLKPVTTYLSGSYLVGRDGNLYPTTLHAPSTTFLGRGLFYVVPTDADFLNVLGKLSDNDIDLIFQHCFVDYCKRNKITEKNVSSSNISRFLDYAEIQYAPCCQDIMTPSDSDIAKGILTSWTDEDEQAFEHLNNKWYNWLKNNFVKLSVMGRIAEFRITSEDNFDWNEIIIDDVILSNDWRPSTKFNILREDSSGYKAYFFNATLDDILENDDVVLASLQELISSKKIVAEFKTRKALETIYARMLVEE